MMIAALKNYIKKATEDPDTAVRVLTAGFSDRYLSASQISQIYLAHKDNDLFNRYCFNKAFKFPPETQLFAFSHRVQAAIHNADCTPTLQILT